MTTDARALHLEPIARRCADEFHVARQYTIPHMPDADKATVKRLVDRLLAGEILSEVPY